MTKKMKIVIGIGAIVVVVIALLIAAYLSNSLETFGLCKPGMNFMTGAGGERFCYTPSGYEGKTCDKQTDCGTANCVLVDKKKTIGKGICKDVTYGCVQFIDKDGNPGQVICID